MAVNSLLHLSASDQESLLAVVQDYFTSLGDDLDERCDSDTDLEDTDKPGILVYFSARKQTECKITIVHVCIKNLTYQVREPLAESEIESDEEEEGLTTEQVDEALQNLSTARSDV